MLVNDDVVKYREWVASVWSVYPSAPLITQVSPSVPTYASIANRHVQPGVLKTQGMTSQDVFSKSATWPRSQADVETMASDNRLTVENEQPLTKHPSADCLYAFAGGIEMKLSTNSVWAAHSVRKLKDSLAQDNVARKKVASETKTTGSTGTTKSSNSKPTSANSTEKGCSSEVTSFSGMIKQSTTSSVRQSLVSSTKTCVVDSTSKSKTVARSGPPSTKATVMDSTSKSKTVLCSGQPSTKASAVDSSSKSKGVSVSGPASFGPQKKTDEQKTSVPNNNVSHS